MPSFLRVQGEVVVMAVTHLAIMVDNAVKVIKGLGLKRSNNTLGVGCGSRSMKEVFMGFRFRTKSVRSRFSRGKSTLSVFFSVVVMEFLNRFRWMIRYLGN